MTWHSSLKIAKISRCPRRHHSLISSINLIPSSHGMIHIKGHLLCYFGTSDTGITADEYHCAIESKGTDLSDAFHAAKHKISAQCVIFYDKPTA